MFEKFEGEGGVPLGRIAETDEMVAAVVYFVSNASSYTTGAMLKIDGGYTRSVV